MLPIESILIGTFPLILPSVRTKLGTVKPLSDKVARAGSREVSLTSDSLRDSCAGAARL